MSKQEEIREGIDEKRETILNFIRAWGVIKHPYGSKDAEGCLAMLSDLGVVIKVKRELPLISEADVEEWNEAVKSGIIVYQRFMVKEGYEATIPLVEEL